MFLVIGQLDGPINHLRICLPCIAEAERRPDEAEQAEGAYEAGIIANVGG